MRREEAGWRWDGALVCGGLDDGGCDAGVELEGVALDAGPVDRPQLAEQLERVDPVLRTQANTQESVGRVRGAEDGAVSL